MVNLSNNKVTQLILAIVILLINVTFAHATVYYVSPAGNDANPGTISLPWQHVAYATCGGAYGCPITANNPNKLQAGDTLILRGGTYNEHDIRVANAGASTNQIMITAYSGETAIVDGGYEGTGNGTHPIFFIDNTQWITFDHLIVRRGSQANFMIAYNNPTSHITIQYCQIGPVRQASAGGITTPIELLEQHSGLIIRHNILFSDDPLPITNIQLSGIVMLAGSNDTIIEHNEFYHLWNGISYKHGSNLSGGIRVRYNKIHDVQSRGIYTRADNGIFENNLIYNADVGIWVYEENDCLVNFGANNIFSHNTIVNCATGIRLQNPGGTCAGAKGAFNTTLTDNVIYNFSDPKMRGLAVWPYYSGADGSNTTFTNNLIYSSGQSVPFNVVGSYYTPPTCPLTLCTNNTQLAPVFRNLTNKDYTLQPISPGKKTGSDGKDIGANVPAVGLYAAPINP